MNCYKVTAPLIMNNRNDRNTQDANKLGNVTIIVIFFVDLDLDLIWNNQQTMGVIFFYYLRQTIFYRSVSL